MRIARARIGRIVRRISGLTKPWFLRTAGRSRHRKVRAGFSEHPLSPDEVSFPMRTSRIAVTATVPGALSLPFAGASSAHAAQPTAAPASTSSYCTDPGPWAVHGTSAVKIRSHPSSKSAALGVLHKLHSFKVKKKSGGWVYVTNKTTGMKGWIAGKYAYRAAGMCLD